MLGGRPGRGWRLCFPLWLRADGSDFGLCGGSGLGTCLLVGWWGPGALAVCRARRGLPVGFLLLRFNLLLGSCPCFVSLLCLDLYVLGDGALVGWGSFVRARCLCDLIRIWVGGEVGAVGPVWALR